jgi:hypothetical protein
MLVCEDAMMQATFFAATGRVAIGMALLSLLPTSIVHGQTLAAAPSAAEDDEPKVLEPPKLPDPEHAKRLSKEDRVWVDADGHQVYVDGAVSLREGYLEMFACTVGTKEHESIVAVQAHAATVHAALLAAGAVAGHPVRYNPDFQPASGTEIDVLVHWLDEQGKWHDARAQDWIRNVKTKKTMTQPWVFAGSGFWVDEKTKKKYYMAEAGDLICVSNFTTAMLDIPIESSSENDALSFEANTSVIPPLGMPVRLVLKPKLQAKNAKPVSPAAP